jgi:histidinol-phosphatase (PHP family)
VTPALVSVHGGHSGEFCNHAVDSLEEIVTTYIDRGFSWVGITEHMPAAEDRFVYSDEQEAGLNADGLLARFGVYVETCKALQQQYRDQIDILVGFETETYSGSTKFIQRLVSEFTPDYIVGSVHHVGDRHIDGSREGYLEAADVFGGVDQLYARYFDEQYAMIDALRPAVVGHFDLIRLFDPDYAARLSAPDITQRIDRNLDLIQKHGLILDCNLRGFGRPAEAHAELYPTREILAAALRRGIAIVPGDDSHGTESVGMNYDKGVAVLQELGAGMDWKKPAG